MWRDCVSLCVAVSSAHFSVCDDRVRFKSSGIWLCVQWYIGTGVSEQLAASVRNRAFVDTIMINVKSLDLIALLWTLS
jgi:hypothetical protein